MPDPGQESRNGGLGRAAACILGKAAAERGQRRICRISFTDAGQEACGQVQPAGCRRLQLSEKWKQSGGCQQSN